MPTDYSGDPVPSKQYYICPHCKEQSPLTKEWVGLTDEDWKELSGVWWEPNENEMALLDWAEAKLKEKNT
jgi:hypothetical protein